ncbi:MAG: ATP-binding protein [Acidimicrobiia bacterium]
MSGSAFRDSQKPTNSEEADESKQRRGSLVRRIGLGAFSLTLILWVVALTVGYLRERSVLVEESTAKVEAVAEVQKARLAAYVDGVEQSVALVASRTRLRVALGEYEASRDADLRDEMEKILSDAVAADDRVVLLEIRDLAGEVVASTEGDSLYVDENQEYLRAAQAGIVTGLIVQDESGGLSHVAAGPVMLEGRLLGVAVVVEAATPILDLVSDYTGLGDTGETVLGRASPDGGVVFLTPLRFDSDAALARTMADGSAAATLVAVSGEEAVLTDAVDYRGEPVFAATRYLDSADWGIVVKVDTGEVLAPLDEYLFGAVFALIVVVAAAAVGSWIVARPVAEGVRRVSEASAAIAAGDWSRNVPVDRNDELGDLAENFNVMTGKLRELTRHLEEKNLEVEARNRELQFLNEKLKLSNEELERFASVAAHDLQEPLRKIQAFGDRLAVNASDSLDEKDQLYIERMRDAATRMRVLIDDLLQLSRVTSQAQPLERVDLSDVVARVADDLESRIDETGAVLEIGTLPVIVADPSQMHSLFLNLISNALKFRKPDQHPLVRISEKREPSESGQNGAAHILVEDNGIGFDPEYGERIFRIFERLNGRADYTGTGIGLAICKKIVNRHDGAITAEGKPGEGAVFTVSLPTHRATNNGETT